MLTEDDTFKALKRTPHRTLVNIVHNTGSPSKKDNNPLLLAHGWTRAEFDKEFKKYSAAEMNEILWNHNNDDE